MKQAPIYTIVNLREIVGDVLCLAARTKGVRDYKAVIHVGSISFSLMSEAQQEAIIEGFRSFISRVGDYDLTIHVKIEPYNLKPYLDEIDAAAARDDLMAEIAADHKTFVLSLAAHRAILQRDFHIIVGADESTRKGKGVAELFDEAKSQLDQRCTDMISDLERLGLTAHRLSRNELANYYLGGLHRAYAQTFPLSDAQLSAVDRPVHALSPTGRQQHPEASPTRDEPMMHEEGDRTEDGRNTHPHLRLLRALSGRQQDAPPREKHFSPLDYPDMVTVADLVAPAALDISRTYIRTHNVTDEYIRGFAVIGYPRQVVAGWLDRLISIDEPLIELCIHIRRLDATRYISKLSRKIITFKGTQRVNERRGRTADPYIGAALEEVDALRDKLVRQEEQVYSVGLYLLVRATSKRQLDERTQRLYSQLKSLDLRAVALTMRHDKALQCVLPGRDVLKLRRILDTSSIITAYPFSDSTLSTPKGILRGMTPQGGLVIMDDFSDDLDNANECRIAKSGAGKSYDAKTWALRCLVVGVKLCVIDFENEHRRIAKRLGPKLAQLIHFRNARLPVNPFELQWTAGEESAMLDEKYQSLMALFDLLIADRVPGVLSQREKAFLTKTFAWLYLHEEKPSMRNFYEALRAEVAGPDSFEIADRVERYVNLFPEETQIDFDKPYTVFNLKALEDVDLQPIALFLITEYTWTQMRRAKHPTPRILLVDEAWKLMKYEVGGRFLSNIARRARKYYLGLVVITQDVEDFLNSEHGRTVLANSSKVFLMKQDATTIDAVTKAFKLSKKEEKYLLGCKKGQGLYFAKGVHIPMQVVASPLEHEVATTLPKEVAELEEEEELREAQATSESLEAA